MKRLTSRCVKHVADRRLEAGVVGGRRGLASAKDAVLEVARIF